MENPAHIIKVIVPDDGVSHIHGVTYDGRHVWAAVGDRLVALDPASGAMRKSVDLAATAGTAFDGRHLYQLAAGWIKVVDVETGECLRQFPAPPGDDCSGMAWSEGSLWIGQYKGCRILEVAPDTGAILRQIEVGRFVTGVTWADDRLWHGSWDGERGALHQIDADSGAVQRSLTLPPGVPVTGMEDNGQGQIFCGAGAQAVIHVVQIGED